MITRCRALARPVPSFGRRQQAFVADAPAPRSSQLSDDLRLFGLTFAGGFLFMWTYLG